MCSKGMLSTILKALFGRKQGNKEVYEQSFRYISGISPAKRVLVLAAHPDDETLGCAGVIALHKRAGADITVVVFTDGRGVHYQGNEDLGKVRRAEAQRAAEILGIDRSIFFDLPDGKLEQHKSEASSGLKEIIEQCKPDIIYAPSPLDFHPDHRAACDMALPWLHRGIITAFYEIYAPIRFNMLVDITDVMDYKESAFSAYKSSLLSMPIHFIMAIKGLNSYRRLLTPISEEERYYEAFWLVDKPLSRTERIRWLTYGL